MMCSEDFYYEDTQDVNTYYIKKRNPQNMRPLNFAEVQSTSNLWDQRGVRVADVIATVHMHKRLQYVWGEQRPLHWNTVGCQDVTVFDILIKHHQNSPA